MTDVPTDPRAEFGSAKRPERASERPRPAGVDGTTVEALGKLSEALEVIENARGHLYEFHRLSGLGDLTLQDAVKQLREAGQTEIADTLDEVLVGRDVIDGKWSFQLVDAYDEQYWAVFRAMDAWARAKVGDAPKHLFEAEVKVEEQH